MSVQTEVLAGLGARREPAARGDALRSAILGGVLSGVAMLVFLVGAALLADEPPLHALRLVAAPFAGGAADPGAGAVLVAALVWVAVSAGLALPFAAIVPRDFPAGSAALLGVAYAEVAMAFATSLVLPALNAEMRDRMPAMGGAWIIAYAVYGLGLGFIPALRRRLARERQR